MKERERDSGTNLENIKYCQVCGLGGCRKSDQSEWDLIEPSQAGLGRAGLYRVTPPVFVVDWPKSSSQICSVQTSEVMEICSSSGWHFYGW